MTTASVVLVAHTALDVDAARRLADYGELDDAGVARALEQVHMQRWGGSELSGHLRRIELLAAVVDDGSAARLIQPTAETERERLNALFAAWPASAIAVVDWDGTARALLAARALTRDLVLPTDFAAASNCALADRAAPAPADHPAPAELVEMECLRLMTGLDASENPPNPAARAMGRYRLWLRWQYCAGRIDAATRADREAQMAELALEDSA